MINLCASAGGFRAEKVDISCIIGSGMGEVIQSDRLENAGYFSYP